MVFAPNGKTDYIPNYGDNNFTIIDVKDHKIAGYIEVGDGPRSLALTPDEKVACVVNYNEQKISIVDVAGKKVLFKVKVGLEPESVAFTSDEKFAFVTNFGSNNVSVVNLKEQIEEYHRVPVASPPLRRGDFSLSLLFPQGKR